MALHPLRARTLMAAAAVIFVAALGGKLAHAAAAGNIDERLTAALRAAGFTGTIEASLERRLGRRVNPPLASRTADS